MDQSGKSGGGEKGSVLDILKSSILRICWPDLIRSMGERGCGGGCSVAQPCLILPPHGPQHAAFPVHLHLLELAQTHVHWLSDAIQTFQPLSSPSPPTFSLSQHQGFFQWVGSLHQVAKVLEYPSNEYSGLISFRMDCFDLLAVQGTLKSPPTPQCKSINSSVLSFLYGLTLTSVHDYWKNRSFD